MASVVLLLFASTNITNSPVYAGWKISLIDCPLAAEDEPGMIPLGNQQTLNHQECVLEVNPVLNQIKDLKGRSQALRGYL